MNNSWQFKNNWWLFNDFSLEFLRTALAEK